MLMRASELFTISDLQQVNSAGYGWFDDKARVALAGRCLLDALEYLRADAKFPGRFWHVTNAHTIRLACRYLSDDSLKRKRVLTRIARDVDRTCQQIREGRNDEPPFYGDDFWDWASVLDAFMEVHCRFRKVITAQTIVDELRTFYDAVQETLSETGDLIMGRQGEWPGPATAAMVHRVLSEYRARFEGTVDETKLEQLRTLALETIKGDKYRGHHVPPHLVRWHYGQIVAAFPDETPEQKAAIADLSPINTLPEKVDRVYALARVIEGVTAAKDKKTFNAAVNSLYACENLKRPLGQGLMADTVKGSLNILEALWPTLSDENKQQIQPMVDTLFRLHVAANTVGIVVAVEREARAIEEAFDEAKGKKELKKMPDDELTTIIDHSNYRVVVRRGKALGDVQNAAQALLKEHKPQWVLMSGIAGSLGRTTNKNGKPDFVGPDKGHVVVAASHAPYFIRQKVRERALNAPVPFEGQAWLTIPADPDLFRLAHRAGEKTFGETGAFHEGLVVTGTGILDSKFKKRAVLAEFPGGLAFEEESYMIALLCLHRNVPFLNIRGISDRAEGDKKKQQLEEGVEEKEQFCAALAAARLTVRVVELLSERW